MHSQLPEKKFQSDLLLSLMHGLRILQIREIKGLEETTIEMAHEAKEKVAAYTGQISQSFGQNNSAPTTFNQDNSQPQAHFHQNSTYIVTPTSVNDPSWYVDSGATYHITSNLNNLSLNSEYKGQDRLVHNGCFALLPISFQTPINLFINTSKFMHFSSSLPIGPQVCLKSIHNTA
ncbi:hypothetical protein ACOSQ3_012687 [Xanthoceras sorbifolium]